MTASTTSCQKLIQERAERFAHDVVYLVSYRSRDGQRVYDWYTYQRQAVAMASKLLDGTVTEVPR